ncbi:bifunctional 4-hydroxy-2-oxoglutarate aldolase/2-dehydro-3-deoxy-phosphogluconate aldolase [Paramicrobacterium chengjingii]|uniref:bifunctional 4-hydroxy-2-oxoglutarate aldolase/2-dehydro-3-deoxy-phosphogluconate aldolase n=1 Tax=Paramicrobacterium chengjingii TaxID=2769067 RepID=UPI0014227F04|nr:bifunctional 4-hydroxy-2-oxoglutarate aldolase/2-dehydro-3-deoxy-phosphogluconate aldolase [Microbacterium chengjingii]
MSHIAYPVPRGIILVIRTDDAAEALLLGRAALQAGVDAVEVTLTVPGAVDVIRKLAADGATVGVGTVLKASDVRAAVRSGASFVVAPNTNPDVITAAHDEGVAMVAGGMTPTEIQHAHQIGSDAIKVFPAGSMGGPQYIRELSGPLPHIPYVISGGVSLANASEYLRADALAICVGRAMFPVDAVKRRDANQLADAARRFVAVAHESTE